MSFPDGFIWGVAASSYQIEGAVYEDGKGLSVWDIFCRKEGAVKDGQSGEVAADHYHRYAEDAAIMKEIGLHAYRLSISWPRVLPEGVGAANPKGLEFYDRLVDELLSAGVTPYANLFHWDYPYELYRRGGWLNPDSSDWFAEYAGVVADKLSDRVRHWMTFNEPQCFISSGHYDGINAPGDRLQLSQVLGLAHNVLLAHGKAVQVIRARSKAESQVGFAYVGHIYMPATESPEDVEAARAATFAVREKNFWNNPWWTDTTLEGHYPQDGLELFGGDAPAVAPGDMETIRQPMDFFGLNNYSGQYVRAGRDGRPETVPFPAGHPVTTYKWPVTPDALYWGAKFFYERYKLPVIISENGMSNTDWVALDGKVHDPQRIDFLKRHLLQVQKALEEGTDIRGYFVWSILDNFEWHEGYRERFGLVHVDFPTGERTLKDSAYWYKDVIAANGAAIERV